MKEETLDKLDRIVTTGLIVCGIVAILVGLYFHGDSIYNRVTPTHQNCTWVCSELNMTAWSEQSFLNHCSCKPDHYWNFTIDIEVR